ncbi:MAG: GNAT family N-acetyltransferase [Lachnospiraceae bacterium]|nr:GNAT family N-acetyltransferase [Lachnospiraceae bacterium]
MGKLRFVLKNKTPEDEEFFAESETDYGLKHDVEVTDSQDEIFKCMSHHMAVIGYEREGQHLSGRFIIGSLWALDRDFVKKVHDLFYRIPQVILKTERTVIRQCDPKTDILPMIELYEKPHVTDFVEPLYPFAEERVYQRDYFDNIYGLYDFGMWNVFLKENGKLIGRCGLEYMNPPEGLAVSDDDPWLELGYVIDPDFWHQGIGYETTEAILQLAYEKGHSHIFAQINEENTASVRLAEKLGFFHAKGDIWVCNRYQP